MRAWIAKKERGFLMETLRPTRERAASLAYQTEGADLRKLLDTGADPDVGVELVEVEIREVPAKKPRPNPDHCIVEKSLTELEEEYG